MPELHEHDAMICRACGREERASEGYPCADCGTFICLICNFRGVVYCMKCAEKPEHRNEEAAALTHAQAAAAAAERAAREAKAAKDAASKPPGAAGSSGSTR